MKLRHAPNHINSLVRKYKGLDHDSAVKIFQISEKTNYSPDNIVLMFQEGKDTKSILKHAENEQNRATEAIYFSRDKYEMGYNGLEY